MNTLSGFREKFHISGAVLKWIAIITMTVDHVAAVLLEHALFGYGRWADAVYAEDGLYQTLYTLYIWMRRIGRIAFPLFCFLIVEGFIHTRSRAKYALRLLIFAAVSEVPFDLAFSGTFFTFSYNNVFFTLLIGLLVIWAIDWGERRFPLASEGMAWKTYLRNMLLRVLIDLAAMFAGAVLAEYLNTDYGAAGVLVIAILWLLRRFPWFAMAWAVVFLALTSGSIEIWAIIDVLFVLLYDGTRGRQRKYFFYVYYPAHLLALALIVGLAG